jgi:hypothetical protein
MTPIPVLQRAIALYLPALLLAGFFAYAGLSAWLSVPDGRIQPLTGPERMIVLADTPFAFWSEVAYRSIVMLGGWILSAALAYGSQANYGGDRLIRGRFLRQQALDKAVRRPLEP